MFHKKTIASCFLAFRVTIGLCLAFTALPVMLPDAVAQERKGPEGTAGEGDKSDENGESGKTPIAFKLDGFVELENYIGTYGGQEAGDAIRKNELRNYLSIQYGTDSFYIKSVTNAYAIPYVFSPKVNGPEFNGSYLYADSFTVQRNLRMSAQSFEINPSELYVFYGGEKFRVTAGNQIIAWGTADVFNPTSFFNPFDLRELLFKDEDELKSGVPSVSGIFFFGKFSAELVLVPVHVPVLMAEDGNFWAIRYREGAIPVVVREPEAMDVSLENIALGGRFAGSLSGTDFSLSLYHGPDKEPALRPVRTMAPVNEPLTLIVEPEYHRVDYIGLDAVKTIDKLTLQAELSYSFDKAGVVDQTRSPSMDFPFEVKKSHYIAYSAGFNYFIPLNRLFEEHEGNTVFTIEWSQSKYLDGAMMDPLITDILSMRLEDSFLDGNLTASITALVDVSHPGTILMPRIGYRFFDTLVLDCFYAFIYSRESSLFGYYRNNDFLSLRIRYEY